jgi:hypothetical protein
LYKCPFHFAFFTYCIKEEVVKGVRRWVVDALDLMEVADTADTVADTADTVDSVVHLR